MLGVAHDRTGCVWHVRYALHDRVHLDGHQMADEANADDTLTDLVTVEASWNAVQGVSACNIQKGLKDKMSFCYVRALAIMLEPTRWPARCLFFSTSESNDASSEGSKLEGTSCMRHRQRALFARLQNSSVSPLVGDRVGTSHGSDLVLHVQQLRRVGDQRARRSPFVQNDA